MISSPTATSSGISWPSSQRPLPTARTLPRCGFSFAVSGSTMPLAVTSSSSRTSTIRRSPKGFRSILRASADGCSRNRWHSRSRSANGHENGPRTDVNRHRWHSHIASARSGEGYTRAVAANLDSQALLAAYDEQLRTYVDDPLPAGIAVEWDGPLLRTTGYPGGSGGITYRDLGGLESQEVDALIARQVELFSARGEWFEWKLHGHDQPADLGARLEAAGFEPEEQETVVIAPVEAIAREPDLPDGVALRQVTTREDLGRIAVMEEAIWGDDRTWLAESLSGEREADPDAITVFVAEAGDDVVCAAW